MKPGLVTDATGPLMPAPPARFKTRIRAGIIGLVLSFDTYRWWLGFSLNEKLENGTSLCNLAFVLLTGP
jgi:hypothetical protein